MSLDKNTLMLHFFGSGRSKSLVGSTTKQTHNDQSTGVLVWIIHINLPSVLVFFFLVYHVRISRALLDVCVAVLLLCQRSPLFEPLFFIDRTQTLPINLCTYTAYGTARPDKLLLTPSHPRLVLANSTFCPALVRDSHAGLMTFVCAEEKQCKWVMTVWSGT